MAATFQAPLNINKVSQSMGIAKRDRKYSHNMGEHDLFKAKLGSPKEHAVEGCPQYG